MSEGTGSHDAPRLTSRQLAQQVGRRLRWRATDPYTISLVVAIVVVCGGIAGLVLGWYGAATTTLAPVQLGYLLSGGIGGITLIGVGLGLLRVQTLRYERAQERAAMGELLRQATRLRERLVGALPAGEKEDVS